MPLSIGVGIDTSKKSANVPLSGVSDISAGTAHTYASLSDAIWCWGYNSSGQLGDGTKINRLYPVQVIMTNGSVLTNATDISGGENHTCAIANTKLVCWGNNNVGQLGDDTLTEKIKAFINGL